MSFPKSFHVTSLQQSIEIIFGRVYCVGRCIVIKRRAKNTILTSVSATLWVFPLAPPSFSSTIPALPNWKYLRRSAITDLSPKYRGLKVKTLELILPK